MKWFCRIDKSNTFGNIALKKKEGKLYTAFVVPQKTVFMFSVFLANLKTNVTHFERITENIFMDLINGGHIIVSFNDIIMRADDLNKHFEVVKMLLELTINNNMLKIHVEKCGVFRKSNS